MQVAPGNTWWWIVKETGGDCCEGEALLVQQVALHKVQERPAMTQEQREHLALLLLH